MVQRVPGDSPPPGKTGKRKKHRENDEYIYFDSAEYERLKVVHAQLSSEGKPPAEPSNGVAHSHFVQLKAALQWLHEEQINNAASNTHWDFVWTPRIKAFHTMVNDRKARMVRLLQSAKPIF